MTYATKFHGFDLGGITIPDGCEDESYQNDACPSFYHHATGLRIWVDWLNPAERDTPRFPRFTLQQDREPIGEEILATTEIYNGDDWSEVTRRATIRTLAHDALAIDGDEEDSERHLAASYDFANALEKMGMDLDEFANAHCNSTNAEIVRDSLAWVTEQESE